MAEPTNTSGSQTGQGRESYAASVDEPVPSANDPGDARRKGYSAEPGPERPVSEDDPVPLASDADTRAHAQKPDQSHAVQPSAPGGDSTNNRVMGADR